jgi:hypothetical protein
MVLVFVCLDWVAPVHPVHTSHEENLALLGPSDARPDCMAILASCLDKFAGAYPVLTTKRMLGRRLSEVQTSLGDLQATFRDSINTLGETPYELISDFIVAYEFRATRSFEWVAIAQATESFPTPHRHRVAGFSGEAADFDATCQELTRLIACAGNAASTPPTPQEMSALLGDRRFVDAVQKHLPRNRASS